MCSEDAQENANNNPEHKEQNRVSPITKQRLGEALILADYLFIDLFEIWPQSHLKALLTGVIGVSAILLIELRLKTWAIATCSISVAAVILYFLFPFVPPEGPTEGWLYPGDWASADTTCPAGARSLLGGNLEDPTRGIVVSLGGSGATIPYYYRRGAPEDIKLADKWNSSSRTILRVGTCDVLKVRRSEGGLAVDADVVYPSGATAAKIRNNRFSLFPPEFLHSEMPDKSTLALRNKDRKLLFWIRYLNASSVEVRGFFSCRNSRMAHITRKTIFLGGTKMPTHCTVMEFPTEGQMSPGLVLSNNGAAIGGGSVYVP